MKTFARVLVVGVPGLCFLTAGVVEHEYPILVFGAVILILLVYELWRKREIIGTSSDPRRQRFSLVLAGIIGATLTINGFVSDGNWIGVVGVVILIGSLLQLYRTGFGTRL